MVESGADGDAVEESGTIQEWGVRPEGKKSHPSRENLSWSRAKRCRPGTVVHGPAD